MFKHQIISAIIICISISSRAQMHNALKYKDMVFANVAITEKLSYNTVDSTLEKKPYLFDLYQPAGDSSAKRPLIIWMHGGGFKFGSKDAKGIKLWSKTFAQRGYVCAAINYRLSKKYPIFNFNELQKSCYYAVQDAKMAVAYFKKHYNEYGIDPDKIILAGNSAGGMMALQAAFSTDTELAKVASITGADNDKYGLFKVAGVINFWGGIFDLDWLKNQQVPIVNVYGSNDKVVSPTHKDTPLYGAIDIHNKADALHLPNKIKVFDGYSHELQKHFNPLFSGGADTQKRWLEAGQFAADFMYNNVIN
jgi:poly(3-hydroxybutyrate) depolymerase